MGIFSKRKASKLDTTRGADGYRECDRSMLQWFQATYESTHTDAVRMALLAARDTQFVVTKMSLVKFINNQEWSDMGGTWY